MTRPKMKKNPHIIAVFEEAQSNGISHSQLITKIMRIFNEARLKTNVDQFTLTFITCLKIAFKSSADFNRSVDQIIGFAVRFIISAVDFNSQEEENQSQDAVRFLYSVFRFFEESHQISNVIVRKRICQFIAKFLFLLSADAYLDNKIWEIIFGIMNERIKDKVPIIRMQAVLAIFRLQDKTDRNCPVTRILINCIETDTCAEVRKLALSRVSLMQKSYIKIIIDRIDDVSEKVRIEAYVALSKLHLKLLTIEQRKRLLYTGLYDNNETVKNTVRKTLLPSWLKRMDGNFLKFLSAFDLNVNSIELMTKTLMYLFENSSCSENIQETLEACLDNKLKVISYEKLTCESSFFWRCYVFHISEMVNEKNNYRWDPNLSYDATQIGMLPDLSVFCEYIKMYYRVHSDKLCIVEKPWQKKEQEYILIQLVELCKVYDYSDEVGRKELKTVCLDLLRHVEIETIKPIVELYFMLQTGLNESLSKITELINDVLYPPYNCEDDSASMESEKSDQGQVNAFSKAECSVTLGREQNIKYKMAQLEVQLDELKEDQEEAIRLEKYAVAEKLKNEMLLVREKICNLKKDLFDGAVCVSREAAAIEDEYYPDESDEDQTANPLENLNIDTVRRCIVILREMLHLSSVKYLTPELRILFQLLVLPASKSNNGTVAPIATEVLGSFCLRDKSLAKDYFTTFFALCGNSDICVSALKVIFDFLLCFGPNTFNINDLDDYKIVRSKSIRCSSINSSENEKGKKLEEANPNDEMISGYTFITVLVDLLDDEYVEARLITVHGLCKLMATGKLKSAKVLTRLILLWFHPTSRESVEIRDCLNFFFPFFAKRCPWSLQLFENAVIPTMFTLFNAPPHNPLCEVDQKSVIKVLCDIVSPNFVENQGESGNTIHCNLAILFCNAIIDLSEPVHQAVLLKGLYSLDLSSADTSLLTTLRNLLKKIIKKFNNRSNYRKLVNDVKKLKLKLTNLRTSTDASSQITNSTTQNDFECTTHENNLDLT